MASLHASDIANFGESAVMVEARSLGESYRSRRMEKVCDVAGRIVGVSAIAPSVYIQHKIGQMREASSLSLSQRYERLRSAGRIYAEDKLAGLRPDDYVALVASVTGLPQSIVSASLINISHGLCHMREILQSATPAGAVWESSAPQTQSGCSFFSRRGDVVAIIAAGNGPGTHGLWPQAVAMGYRTLVKPSLREPFTAQRLVHALEQAGLAAYVALIPTDRNGAEALISQSDLAVVYGGPDVASRYGNDPRVLVQGPGRSKIVVGSDVAREEAVALAAESLLSLGGAACVCASAVLVEGDDAHAFAGKLRRELEARSQRQPLPLGSQQQAEAYERLLRSDDVAWTFDRAAVQGCPLTPHVAVVGHASDPKVQRELPFPCVTVAPFDSRKDCKFLSGSLVTTVLSRQQELIRKILDDPSIANVYIGNIPTTWMDYRVPHDGYLADFLMRNRGIRVDSRWMNAAIPL